jgi:DNA-directed RNA polymerase subunit RPC12/RpoP
MILVTVVTYRLTKHYGGESMDETITFWLDNKICSGFKIAEIGRQALVSYRDKYYIIVGGAALMKGVRPLHYSKTSMPLLWKKAMKGILPPPVAAIEHAEDEFLPVTTSTKKERKPMQKNTNESEFPEAQPVAAKPVSSGAKKPGAAEVKPVKIIQAVITATCPYCSHKQDLPFEKGKNGKPFFVACVRCSTEFAVRFVPVTMYQAQVAAFK